MPRFPNFLRKNTFYSNLIGVNRYSKFENLGLNIIYSGMNTLSWNTLSPRF